MTRPDGPQFAKFHKDVTYSQPGGSWEARDQTSGDEVGRYTPSRSTTSFTYRPDGQNVSAGATINRVGRWSKTSYPKNYDYTDDWASRTAEEGETIPMFTHSEVQPSSTVSYMGGTKGARVGAMTMMGIADIDTRVEHGHGLTSDTSLSQHSRKLVNRLEGSGAVDTPSNTSSNSVSFWKEAAVPAKESDPVTSQSRWVVGDNDAPVPQDLVKAGKNRARSIASSTRPSNKTGLGTESDHEQLKLDDI